MRVGVYVVVEVASLSTRGVYPTVEVASFLERGCMVVARLQVWIVFLKIRSKFKPQSILNIILDNFKDLAPKTIIERILDLKMFRAEKKKPPENKSDGFFVKIEVL